jgi:hypothetical protein
MRVCYYECDWCGLRRSEEEENKDEQIKYYHEEYLCPVCIRSVIQAQNDAEKKAKEERQSVRKT